MMRLPALLSPHVDDRALLQSLDDESHLSEAQGSHVAHCDRCSVALDDLRAIRRRAKNAVPAHAPREEILTRIHARIDADEAVLLPAWSPVPPDVPRVWPSRRPSRSVLMALVAAACAVLVVWLPRGGSEAQAGGTSGTLRFIPAAPRPGDSVTVEYRAPVLLQAAPRLRLRARLRSEWNDAYATGIPLVTVATLRRGRDGVHRGGFRLAREVVYASFAVEDTTARRVDSRNRRLWELIFADSAGQPLPTALEQRENELMGRDSPLALETNRERVALTPDDPAARAKLYFFETINLGADADSALPAHAREWWRLHRLWSARAGVPFAVVDGMLKYAVQIAEPPDSIAMIARRVWRPRRDSAIQSERIDREGAEARWAMLNSMAMRAMRDSAKLDSAVVALNQAEHFWNHGGQRVGMAPQMGLQIARVVRDSTGAQLRWTDRLARRSPEYSHLFYQALAERPALRGNAQQRLLARYDVLRRRDDARRPLEFSIGEAIREDSAQARDVLGALADVELASGDTVQGRSTLLRATAAGWSVNLFRRAVRVLSATGDRTAALPLMANVAVDPGTPATEVDSLTKAALGLITQAAWQRALDRSRLRMRDYFLATAISVPLAGGIPLRGVRGETSLASVAGARASVIVFWSRDCGPSRDQMTALDTLSARLARLGAALVPITREPITPEVIAFLAEKKVTVPVYSDVSGSAQRAFDQWSWPYYVVVDANGVIRYRHSSLDLVLAQVAALRKDLAW